MKHFDLMFGIVGTVGTATLSQINTALAFVAGVLTVFVMAMRALHEWRRRNE